MRYLLVGNYGVGNLGDEALKAYFLRSYPEVDWQVLSAAPLEGELPRLPGGIRSFLCFDWLKTVRALQKADGVVFGGGSLFTDVESPYACFLWWSHAFWAWVFHKPYILAFQGIGPFKTRFGAWFARRTCRRAVSISVRDPLSFRRVQSWETQAKLHESFDPIFTQIQKREYELTAEEVLVVIPRANANEQFFEALRQLLSTERWSKVTVVTLDPDNPQERETCTRIRKHILKQEVQMVPVRQLSDLAEAVAQGSFVLSQRYHGGVAALALGRDMQLVPQAPEDKIDSLLSIQQAVPLAKRREYLQQLVTDEEQRIGFLLAEIARRQ